MAALKLWNLIFVSGETEQEQKEKVERTAVRESSLHAEHLQHMMGHSLRRM